MNVPNKLTLGRLVLTLLFVLVFFSQVRFRETIALLLFSAASITDYFDGKIARRDKLITNFGILMDPLADKILICSAFIAFVGYHLMPAWMVIIIVARELAITGLRLLAASRNVVLAAEGYGKHKTISQMIAILSVLLLLSYPDWGDWARPVFGFRVFNDSWLAWFTELAKWLAVFFTAFSGVMYLWRNRQIYLQDM